MPLPPETSPGPVSAARPPGVAIQRAIVALLRREPPEGDFDTGSIDAALSRYECGGYLHRLWEGSRASLPSMWARALERTYRKTSIDNLSALGGLRALGRCLNEERIPFILLKGASYLTDLYDDPGERMITDIDLLLRKADVERAASRLARDGFRREIPDDFPYYGRFEMSPPWDNACRFEIHWRLGLPVLVRLDPASLWESSVDCSLEGVACRRLAPVDALLYHVGHAADHYFGPTLKWTIDLRQMIRRWKPDPDLVLRRAAIWRVHVALYLALQHVEKLFPGEVPPGLTRSLAPAGSRRRGLAGLLSRDPAELLDASPGLFRRYRSRFLMIDRGRDALALSLRVLLRPLTNRLQRAAGGAIPLGD